MSEEQQNKSIDIAKDSTVNTGSQLSNYLDAEELYKSQKLYKSNIKLSTKPIHEEPLEIQQKRLFEAFFKGDEKYIYEFDKETMNYREKYIRKISQQGLTVGLYCTGINWFIYQYIFKNGSHNIAMKIGSFTVLNAIPLSYFAYNMLTDYNRANEFLFTKYLKKH